MESKQFMQDALRTESKPDQLAFSLGGTVRLFQLLVCAAEVADTCKRAIFYGKPLASDKLTTQLQSLEILSADLRQQNTLGRLTTREDYRTPFTAPNLRLLHAAIGIFGESGEMLEALLAQMQGDELDLVNFAEELGDVDWYKAIAHDETGISEEAIRAAVIAKLKARYGDKFSSDAAHNRDLDAERAVLESGIQA